MPAKSKKQQQLFGIVKAYRDGTLPAEKASALIKRLAKSMKDSSIEKYASTPSKNLPTIAEDDTERLLVLNNIAKTGKTGTLDGVEIDQFTAKLIIMASLKLSPKNRKNFLHHPIKVMVALAYKLITR